MRLFIALSIPELIAQQVALLGGGIPGARWEAAKKLHLTLRFLGDVEGAELGDVTDALGRVRADPFELTLAGVGHFPPRGQPRNVWVGVDDKGPVTALHETIERVLQSIGIDPDRRNFAPHVTLARLKGSPERKVAEFLAHHSLFRAPPFPVDSFALMSSVLSPSGSKYRVERRYRVAG